MNCREVRMLADSYLDDELLVETNQSLLAHLGHCPACRAELQRRETVRTTLKKAFDRNSELAPSAQFRVSLENRLRSRMTSQDSLKLMGRWPWLAAAAVLVIALTAWYWMQQASFGPGGSQRVDGRSALARLAEPAAGDHRDCALGHQLSEPPVNLEDAARLDPAFPGLHEAADRNAGSLPAPMKRMAAHVCLWQGHRFGHVVFSYKNEIVSLLVTNYTGDAPAYAATGPAECPPTSGFTIACFAAPRHAVFVVSSLPSSDTMSVAHALAPSVRDHLTRAIAALRHRLRELS